MYVTQDRILKSSLSAMCCIFYRDHVKLEDSFHSLRIKVSLQLSYGGMSLQSLPPR